MDDFSTEMCEVFEKYISLLKGVRELVSTQLDKLQMLSDYFDSEKLEDFSHGFT